MVPISKMPNALGTGFHLKTDHITRAPTKAMVYPTALTDLENTAILRPLANIRPLSQVDDRHNARATTTERQITLPKSFLNSNTPCHAPASVGSEGTNPGMNSSTITLRTMIITNAAQSRCN